MNQTAHETRSTPAPDEPRDQTPDINREKILQSAASEIHRCGFQAASIAKILSDTGLTKGALYHHFPSKQQLGLAVVDEVILPSLAERILDPLRHAERPVEALLDYLQFRRETMTDESIRLGCPLNNLTQEMSPLDDDFKARLNEILQTWQSVIEQALVTGQAQGQIRPDVDCGSAALFIVSAWEGCWGMAKNRQSVAVFQQCLSQLRNYVLNLGPHSG
ncbi:TetR family transcriptional regulator [Halothiobacillus diazotrophicus]|uniref:TetR family transcriptional regulator n=1 Tax=Halothiobacillus diazotrophicus TaxID=1860122 RepID=A0A191ZJ89_9GAMM|nr:TetR/AcrR family transcriptional regulator [Halothiobacillus diazotrophicus]ANJ67908.1 TetR family transcriptional regulator [Halothiobacillus diazotrophicus]